MHVLCNPSKLTNHKLTPLPPFLPYQYEDTSPKVTIEELVEGDGDFASHGDLVEMSYVGKLDSGHTFDSAKSFKFTLGAGDVIKGWDQGIDGMRVGGERKVRLW
jgi:FKBP-type peptidyl-prolyl cis-trans isomerase